jgi:hypothetical protein
MNDRYTKAVLTVIAAALAAMAIERATPAAQAAPPSMPRGAPCGSSHMTPCYIVAETGMSPLDVRVANSN